jgi:hypothetical protein
LTTCKRQNFNVGSNDQHIKAICSPQKDEARLFASAMECNLLSRTVGKYRQVNVQLYAVPEDRYSTSRNLSPS